jgi:YD repeat-containing protein
VTGAVTATYGATSGVSTYDYLTSVADSLGDEATYGSYDSLGDLTSFSTYPVAGSTTVKHTTTLAYDANQRLTQITNPDGTTEKATYSGKDLASVTDEAGTVWDYTWNLDGSLLSASGPLGWTESYAYNTDRSMTTLTNALDLTTTYTYGNANELKSASLPDGVALTYDYDTAGNVVKVVDGRSHAIEAAYDADERITSITYPTSGQTGASATYNTDSTLATLTDAIGTATYAYNSDKTVSSVVYNESTSGLAALQEIDYTYTTDRLLSALTWKSGGTAIATWTYSYDAAGRLTGVSNGYGESTTYTYDGESKLKSQTNSNGTAVAYTYNELRGWPSLISDTITSGSASYALTYASGANTVPLITGVTESNGSTVAYNYDALYRLTSDTRTGTNPFSGSYAYDLAGNPTSYNGSTYSYNGGDLFSTVTYDGDGNPTKGTFGGYSSTLTWNDNNKLTALTNSNATVDNGYGADGLRGWSEVGSNAKTFSVYANGFLIGEISATGLPIAAYTWGNGVISEHRYDTTTPTSFWYL